MVSSKRLDAELVVRAIEHHQRLARNDIETAGPVDRFEAAADRVLVDVPSQRAHRFERGDRDSGILMLKRSRQRKLDILHLQREALVIDSMRGGM